MLATAAGALPDGPGWSYEMKWDGVRALLHVEGGALRVFSRTEREVTDRYPELAGLGPAVAAATGGGDAILDGEVVVLDDTGRPSFEALQRHAAPAVAMVFDVIELEGEPVLALPYVDRRARLVALDLNGPNWQTPPASADGPAAFATAERLGLEGVVAKRDDSRYTPGQRSPGWRKVKVEHTQELVVGGWLPGERRLEGRLGSLLVGVYDDTGLRYSGRVGSGIAEATREELERLLAVGARTDPPFTDPPRLRAARWVEPELVVEVRFTEWTAAGLLRQPSYRGLRDDKEPTEVVREDS